MAETAGAQPVEKEQGKQPHEADVRMRKKSEPAAQAAGGKRRYIYLGPDMPGGKLRQNAVFSGGIDAVGAYLADELGQWGSEAALLLVPLEIAATVRARVKTPGNVSHEAFRKLREAAKYKGV